MYNPIASSALSMSVEETGCECETARWTSLKLSLILLYFNSNWIILVMRYSCCVFATTVYIAVFVSCL